MDLWLSILLQLILIALNAIFASAEIAVIEIKGPRLNNLAEEGNKKALKLKKLSDDPARFLATIQVAITLSGFLASAFAAENFSIYIVRLFEGLGLSSGVMKLIDILSVVIVTVLLSYVTLIFGELVPKRIAMKKSEKTALGLADTVGFVSVVFRPLVSLLTVSTNAVLRLVKINPNEEEEGVSEEEIRMMADAGTESGCIDASENEIIQNVFEFDDISVEEICTHRTGMKLLWLEDGDAVWEKTVRDNTFRFYPICGEDVDHIVGILDSDKYLRMKDRSRENVLSKAVSEPVYVIQSMKADALFKDMKENKYRFVIVVDEYGGTFGLITVSDLIEEIVGDIDDDAKRKIRRKGDGYTVSALTSREDLDGLFDVETGGDAATVGGWVTDCLGCIPDVGQTFSSDGIDVQVTRANEKRVIEIFAKKTRPAADEGDDGAHE